MHVVFHPGNKMSSEQMATFVHTPVSLITKYFQLYIKVVLQQMDANSTMEVAFEILKATGILNMKDDEECTDDDNSSSELLPRVNWIRKSSHTPYVDVEAHSGL